MSNDTLTTRSLPVMSGHGAALPTGILRAITAVLVLVGGLVHLRLYVSGGYSGIPVVGPMFLANVVGSGLVVLGLALRPGRVVHLAGIALSLGSLVALLVSHTVGIAGFTEATVSSMQLAVIASQTLATLGFGWLLVRSR